MDAKEAQTVKTFTEELDKFVSSKIFSFVDYDDKHGSALRVKIPEVIDDVDITLCQPDQSRQNKKLNGGVGGGGGEGRLY